MRVNACLSGVAQWGSYQAPHSQITTAVTGPKHARTTQTTDEAHARKPRQPRAEQSAAQSVGDGPRRAAPSGAHSSCLPSSSITDAAAAHSQRPSRARRRSTRSSAAS